MLLIRGIKIGSEEKNELSFLIVYKVVYLTKVTRKFVYKRFG